MDPHVVFNGCMHDIYQLLCACVCVRTQLEDWEVNFPFFSACACPHGCLSGEDVIEGEADTSLSLCNSRV